CRRTEGCCLPQPESPRVILSPASGSPLLRIGSDVLHRGLRLAVCAAAAHSPIELFDPAVEHLDPVTDVVLEALVFETVGLDPLSSLFNHSSTYPIAHDCRSIGTATDYNILNSCAIVNFFLPIALSWAGIY